MSCRFLGGRPVQSSYPSLQKHFVRTDALQRAHRVPVRSIAGSLSRFSEYCIYFMRNMATIKPYAKNNTVRKLCIQNH